MSETACELCTTDGGETLYRDAELRIVAVTGADSETYRGFCRVIWNRHIKEMTDLNAAQRSIFMDAVFKLESVLRDQLSPEKMNIASLGNMTPHLHWHVIPRFVGDATFPKPIWATPDHVPAEPYIGTLSAGKAGAQANTDWRSAIQNAFALKK
jgi:diadenosine tetraphosphate (Ap4A) HIT family hydrolase